MAHVAAWEGDLARVQELVSAANVEVRNRYMQTVLHRACEGGRAHVVEWLLRLGADRNARGPDGSTPLHTAAWNSHPRCVQLLLEGGADACIACDYMTLPLHVACSSAECAALLIAAHPAAVDRVCMETPLHYAARLLGTVDVCSVLVGSGSVVDARNSIGLTPLFWALRCWKLYGQRDVAELLLDHGARLERVMLGDGVEVIPDWAVSFVVCRNACRSSCWALLELARRRSRVIGGNGRDVLKLIAQLVWKSRREESWAAKVEPKAAKVKST